MSYGLPTRQLPRSIRYQIKALCWLFEKRYLVLAALYLLALSLLIGAYTASAGCGTVPDRYGALCEPLGYEGSDCDLQWERDDRGRLKGVWGTLTLTADNNVDEPLTGSEETRTATLFRFTTPRVEVQKIFSVTAPNWHGFYKDPSESPCVSPRCSENQTLYGREGIEELNYRGVGENELLDVARVMSKVLYHPPDARIVAAVQAPYGARGIPVVVWSGNPRLRDESETELATELKLDVIWFFALPAE